MKTFFRREGKTSNTSSKEGKNRTGGNAPLKNSASLLKTFLFGKNQKNPALSGRIFFFEKSFSPLF